MGIFEGFVICSEFAIKDLIEQLESIIKKVT